MTAFCGNKTQVSSVSCGPSCRHDFLESPYVKQCLTRTWNGSINAVAMIRVLNVLSCLDQRVLGSLTDGLPRGWEGGPCEEL